MSATEMAAVLPSAEKVVTTMISRSATLFRLPDNVLRDMEHHWAVVERAAGGVHPSRRVERRCAMKRTRAEVSHNITVCLTRVVKTTHSFGLVNRDQKTR